MPTGDTLNAVAISVHMQPSREDALAVHDFLRTHNESHMGTIRRYPLTIIARAADGTVVGGVHAETMWGWLHVATLAVHEEWRGQGLGTRLLAAVEDEGVRRGCTNVWLDTFSFQAKPFYERHGYRVFGTLEDFPPGETRYFMTKALAPR
jgi:GNAT superfamily N-acetyltransferase